MVRRLRWQFISVSLSALFVAIVLVQVFVICLVRSNIASFSDKMMDEIVARKGMITEEIINSDIQSTDKDLARTLYKTGYLVGWLDAEGNISEVDITHIRFSSEEDMSTLISAIWGKKNNGYVEYNDSTYAYRYVEIDGRYLFIIVDISSRAELVSSLMTYMLLVSIIIVVIYFFLIIAYSAKVVRPHEEAQERQKRFITNASHELKTPLAVIRANTDMLEMLHGENKWVESTTRQIDRMNRLIAELVSLARLEEKGTLELKEVDLSAIVAEATENFEPVIHGKGKRFSSEIERDICIKGEERTLVELAGILLDNAAKYCDDNGLVDVKLRKIGKKAELIVSNTYMEGKGVDYHKFFERFYREDESHHSGKKGYGIGLAIAKQICEKLGGSLTVSYREDTIYFVVSFVAVR